MLVLESKRITPEIATLILAQQGPDSWGAIGNPGDPFGFIESIYGEDPQQTVGRLIGAITSEINGNGSFYDSSFPESASGTPVNWEVATTTLLAEFLKGEARIGERYHRHGLQSLQFALDTDFGQITATTGIQFTSYDHWCVYMAALLHDFMADVTQNGQGYGHAAENVIQALFNQVFATEVAARVGYDVNRLVAATDYKTENPFLAIDSSGIKLNGVGNMISDVSLDRVQRKQNIMSALVVVSDVIGQVLPENYPALWSNHWNTVLNKPDHLEVNKVKVPPEFLKLYQTVSEALGNPFNRFHMRLINLPHTQHFRFVEKV